MAEPSFPSHAIILAAGLGLRMRPLTDKLPKPLIRVAGKCLVDYALDFVESAGIGHVVVNASYLAEMLESHVKTRRSPQVSISHESQPLETGGGIREALKLLGGQPFVSVNGDVICVNRGQHALKRLRDAWDETRMDALLLVQPVERTVGYDGPGDFFVGDDGAITRRGERSSAPYVFAGIQLLHPRFFNECPPEGPFSLNLLYNRGINADGTLNRVFALPHQGDWLHIGDPAGVRSAEAYFAQARRA